MSAQYVVQKNPGVWHAAQMADAQQWTIVLDAAQREEIAAALDFARKSQRDPMLEGTAAFPLPHVADLLQSIADELEDGRGFVLLRGLDLQAYTAAEIDLLYAGLGQYLGTVLTQNTRGDRIGRVTDHGTDYTRQAVRGHISNGEILPHCDSADVVGLLCVHPALDGGQSTLASSAAIYQVIVQQHSHLLPILTRGFRINLAGKGPSGDPKECSNQVIPVFSVFQGKLSCRYNRKQIEEAAEILGKPLNDDERQAIALVGELAMSDELRLDMDFQRGDIQFLNNHAILHARRAYTDDPDPSRRRLLLRLWLNAHAARPLAPEFADRLNTGPRGEVKILN